MPTHKPKPKPKPKPKKVKETICQYLFHWQMFLYGGVV